MRVLPVRDPALAAKLPSSPEVRIRDALTLAKVTGVPRLHLHAFGYYILILNSGTSKPELSRNALLFAARVTANTAGSGEQVLSREGLLAYSAVREMFGPDKTPGVFKEKDRVIVFVPTNISHNVQKTTGLGDILSSTAFVADRF